MVQQPWKTVWQFLTKLNILLPYNAAFTLLWYWPKGTENLYVHKNLHLDVFSSLIHYFKNLEAVRMPCNRWMDKLRLIQAMECYSALKRNELPSHGKTQRKLTFILLSETSQSEKVPYCMIPTVWHSGKGKTMETIKRLVVATELLGQKGIGRAQIFTAVNTLYDIIMIDTGHYIVVNTHSLYNTKWTPV